MSHEIEVKFRVADFAPIRTRLAEEGAVHAFTVLQTDRYYDTPAGMLRGRDCGLRIRTVESVEAGSDSPDLRPLMTAKGPGKGAGSAKVRREAQVRLDDAEAVEEILAAVGMVPTATVQKQRETYRLDACTVELDELPVIGRFVEVESPSEAQLAATCQRLGFGGERITGHYVELLLRASGGDRREFLLGG